MPEACEIADDVSLLALGITDSAGLMELVVLIEDAFQIDVQDNEIVPENFDTLNAIQAFVDRKSPCRAAG
jgi:acyl carrier protein